MTTPASTSAREEVLARIRRAVAEAPPAAEVPRSYARSRALGDASDIVERFAERVADYRAEVRRVAPGELARSVAEAGAAYAVRRLVLPPGVPGEWLAALDGVELLRDGESSVLSAADLDRTDAVLTGAAVGIAETGTIVLDGGEAQGRRALSLVPDVHVCVVTADQVVDDVPAAVARLRGAVLDGRPLTWISGPSATSDIELNRVEGVHGPRTLHVLVVG